MLSRVVGGRGLFITIQGETQACTTCLQKQSNLPHLLKPVQWKGTFPGEDWQLDFTQVPKCQGYEYLLVYVDSYSGWIKVFPTHTEKAQEVVQTLLKEIIPRLRLPMSL
jgi:transposase InsO family protein